MHPAFDNLHFVPQLFDPGWLGSIEGEVVNDQPTYTLKSVTVSAVVFDRSGNVLGGGNGFAFGILPPGAREVLMLNNGLSSIPFEQAERHDADRDRHLRRLAADVARRLDRGRPAGETRRGLATLRRKQEVGRPRRLSVPER